MRKFKGKQFVAIYSLDMFVDKKDNDGRIINEEFDTYDECIKFLSKSYNKNRISFYWPQVYNKNSQRYKSVLGEIEYEENNERI